MNRLLSTRRNPLTALSLVAALAGACGRDAEPPGVRVVDRLIATEPAGAFEDSVAGRWVPLVEWDLRAARDQERWEIVAGGDWDSGNGMPLSASLVRLRATEPFDAAGAASLRLDLNAPRRCLVAVHWRGASEPWVTPAPPSPERMLRVDLASSPEWADSADSIVVTLRSCRGGRLTGMALEGRADRLDEAFTQAWKVTLADDTRSAVLAAPGTERLWKLPERVESARLHLGVGTTENPGAPVRFTVGARTPAGHETVLREVTLDPQTADADPRWTDLQVPLSDLPAGSEILLRADSELPWRPGDAVPAFAEPRILAGEDDPRPNILLLSIDTLRADHLSLYGYERETSPHLDRRASAAGITFSNVVAPSGWTLPSHVSLLSGLDALRHGVNHEKIAMPTSLRFAVESLRDAGYATVAFTAGGYVSPEFGFGRGFESFRARRPQQRSVQASRAELGHGTNQTIEWLAQPRDQPFFAFFHTYEVHAPFWAREPYFERFGGRPENVPLGYAFTTEDRARAERVFVIPDADGNPLPDPDPEIIKRLYDSGIAYMDSELERLFSQLEASGLAENTIVVLTSDHGESFGEHDLVGHGPAYDQVIMIPLVLWVPGLDSARRLDAQVRLVDVAPTLLDLAGLEQPDTLDGQSLRPLWEDVPGYEQRPAWIHAGRFGIAMRVADRMKYVWHRVPWGFFGVSEQLFDLRADPSESHDLSAVDPELLSSAREQARAWLLDHLPGPRLTFENGSDHPFELRLTSAQNLSLGVNGFGCPDLGWRPPHTVIVGLDAGTDCKLVLEHLRASDLTVEARRLRTGRAESPTELKLTGAEVAGPTSRMLVDGAWQARSDDEGSVLSVRVEWLHEPEADAAEVEIDEALADQLRALGYLD